MIYILKIVDNVNIGRLCENSSFMLLQVVNMLQELERFNLGYQIVAEFVLSKFVLFELYF